MADETKTKVSDGLQLNKKTIAGIIVILVAIMIAAGILTQTLPRGEYNTFIDPDSGKATITTESEYHELEDYKMPIWKILLSPVLVFIDSETRSDGMTGLLIVAFIIFMGGTFLLLDRCNVLKYIVASIIRKFGNHRFLLLGIVVFFFMMLASTAGTLEESVTLVPICSAIALALGWDSMVGLGMSIVAIAFGFTAATFNPFNVLTVQKLAGDVNAYSGLWLRIIVFVLVYLGLFGFLVLYAKRIEKDPTKSICYESDKEIRLKYSADVTTAALNDPLAAKAAKAFFICLGCAFVCIVSDFVFSTGGVLSMGGIAVFFVLGGILAGKFTGMKAKEILGGFGEGVKTIAPALPLVFAVISIAYILNKGKIMHTLLYWIYNYISGMSPYSAILLIFLFIALLEFFIGSGTAKAFLVMPLVIPLAHLIGISSNTVTLSFCLADGFTNLLYPTSGIMIIAIGLVNVSYGKWLKFSWPLFLIEGAISVAVMMLAVYIGYH